MFVGWASLDVNNDDASSSSTFSSFKRLMGYRASEINNNSLLVGLNQLPYTILEGDRGEALIYCAGADGMVSPVELSSWMIQHLVHIASTSLKESVSGAVVAVPAHFNPQQRGATLEAAKLAGIAAVHLLQEPVAAALAYGIDGGTDGETVLVFDIGGGTFDVSILQAFEGILQVLGTGGDSRLGGDDVDALLADWILRRVSNDGDSDTDVRKWALTAAKEAKEALSTRNSTIITIPHHLLSSLDDNDDDDDDDDAGSSTTTRSRIELSREEFECVIEVLFHRMASVLDCIGSELFVEWAVPPFDAIPSKYDASKEEEFQKEDSISNNTIIPLDKWAPPPRRITKVALVGQITRLPSIRLFVERLTGVTPCTSIDPGQAVALGAATQAGILLGSVGSVELMDGSFVVDLHSRVTGFSDWQP